FVLVLFETLSGHPLGLVAARRGTVAAVVATPLSCGRQQPKRRLVMVERERTTAEHDARHTRREWLHVLLAGLGLFVVTTIVMFVTGNPNLYPTVILIGNFLVPVVFVLYLYDQQDLSTLAPEMLARSFVIGGLLGVLGASVLEPLLIPPPA